MELRRTLHWPEEKIALQKQLQLTILGMAGMFEIYVFVLSYWFIVKAYVLYIYAHRITTII